MAGRRRRDLEMKPKREQPILTVVCWSRAQCRVPPRALVPCQWARSGRLPNRKSWPLKLQSAALAAVELPLPGRVGGCSIGALRSSCPRLHCVSWPSSLACGFLFVMHHPSASPFPSLISLNTSNNNRNRRRHHHRHTATREQHRMHATLTVNRSQAVQAWPLNARRLFCRVCQRPHFRYCSCISQTWSISAISPIPRSINRRQSYRHPLPPKS